MQALTILFNAPGAEIPVNYQHGVQSMLYEFARPADASGERWHDGGASYGKRRFKLFVFSMLRGNFKLADRRLRFESTIQLDVRSVDDEFIDALANALYPNRTANLLGAELRVASVTRSAPVIDADLVTILARSPIVARQTLNDGRSRFFTPQDPEFAPYVDGNFRRKYASFTNTTPDSGITLAPLNVTARNKVVTRFKDVYITGWKGQYALSGRPEYLNFLLYSGLGSSNSAGFGYFDVMETNASE